MTNKKKVFVVAVAVCLIAILSMSSLAWFSDADEVTNQFIVSSDDPVTPDSIFSVDIWEDVNGAEDGGIIAEGDVTTGQTYDHVFPGQVLLKEPHVENTGKYDQWIRVKVTFDNANDWVAVMGKYGYALHDLLYVDETTKLTATGTHWVLEDGETSVDGDAITYVFYYDSKLTPGENVTMFKTVNLPTELNQYDMALFEEGKFTMKLVAEAVQADNTGATAQEAFELVTGDQEIKLQ